MVVLFGCSCIASINLDNYAGDCSHNILTKICTNISRHSSSF
jgi:hypothetical protein